jgi:hypothetical protein
MKRERERRKWRYQSDMFLGRYPSPDLRQFFRYDELRGKMMKVEVEALLITQQAL